MPIWPIILALLLLPVALARAQTVCVEWLDASSVQSRVECAGTKPPVTAVSPIEIQAFNAEDARREADRLVSDPAALNAILEVTRTRETAQERIREEYVRLVLHPCMNYYSQRNPRFGTRASADHQRLAGWVAESPTFGPQWSAWQKSPKWLEGHYASQRRICERAMEAIVPKLRLVGGDGEPRPTWCREREDLEGLLQWTLWKSDSGFERFRKATEAGHCGPLTRELLGEVGLIEERVWRLVRPPVILVRLTPPDPLNWILMHSLAGLSGAVASTDDDRSSPFNRHQRGLESGFQDGPYWTLLVWTEPL